MIKVLLLLDDYSELVANETLLKKVGFDCMGMTNENSLTDTLISFHPDVVIATGRGKRISGFSVGRKIRELKNMNCRLILLFPQNQQPNLNEISSIRLDAMLESPVNPLRMIEVIAKLNQLKPEPLIEKFHRSRQQQGSRTSVSSREEARSSKGLKLIHEDFKAENSERFSTDSEAANPVEATSFSSIDRFAVPTPEQDQERVARYKNFLKDIAFDRSVSKINRVEARARMKLLQPSWDMKLNQKIDELKKEFVSALFKKKG